MVFIFFFNSFHRNLGYFFFLHFDYHNVIIIILVIEYNSSSILSNIYVKSMKLIDINKREWD